ncbi:MAG: insulinase family protein [Rhodobacter sp.]|nr:insulinase family protein [Rhodobacter sp.]
MRHLVACLIACLVTVPATAAEVTSFSLENGLDVVVIEDHRAPVVVHMVWYKAGAADEPPGKSGIAHFLEHLLFKGTDDMAPGEFSSVVAKNGGSDNAFTSWDYTGYFQRVAADRLELMMRMEADRMRDLRLTPEDIGTERDVILEERNQRVENDPGALFGEQRNAAMNLNHPYGIPVIGWKHEAAALELEDALAFYRTYYAPNNAYLIVAGDVQPDEVRALAEKYYGPLAPTPGLGDRVRPSDPPHLAERRLIFEDPRVSEPYVVRTYRAPERDPGAQEQAAALVLLSDILGGNGATSVLGQKLQFEQQKAIYASAFYQGLSYDDTMFGLIIVPVPGVTLQEAEDALDKAIAEFIEEGVDPVQLDRIKMQMRASQIYEQDSVQRLARRYGAALTSGLTLEDIEAWPGILQAVTAEDIMAAAETVFDRKNSVTGWLQKPQSAEVTQ